MTEQILLSICIVSYNVREYLEICIDSILEHASNIKHEIIVVDNNSKDNTKELFSAKYTGIKFIASDKNLGFAAANNIAIKESQGQYIILLNPDTKICNNSLQNLIACLKQHPECGVVGPQLLNKNDSLQNGLREFPRLSNALIRNSWLKHIPFFKKRIDKYHMRNFDLTKSGYVDQVSGAAMMFSKATLQKIGLLDEMFFIFFEEVDFCKRVRDAGLKVFYFPQSQIYHWGGKSREQDECKIKLIYLESLLKYLRKHHKQYKYLIFIILFKPLYLLSFFLNFISTGLILLFFKIFSLFNNRILLSRRYVKKVNQFNFYKFFIKNKLFQFIVKF